MTEIMIYGDYNLYETCITVSETSFRAMGSLDGLHPVQSGVRRRSDVQGASLHGCVSTLFTCTVATGHVTKTSLFFCTVFGFQIPLKVQICEY